MSAQPPQANAEEDHEVDYHLWGYLVPQSANPKVLRIDFWRITPSCSLGRDPELNTLILPGPYISRTHAIISWNRKTGQKSVVQLKDVSRSGTWVNGQLIGCGKSYSLKDGDEIGFGAPVAVLDEGGLYDYRYKFRNVSMKPRIRLDDFYIKGRLLGEGSFGSVYQATDRRTDNIVAIKTIKYPAGDTFALIQNLEEIAAMENIQHPHVIKIFAAHHSETVPQIYLILEYMPDNLYDYMQREIETRALWPNGPAARGLPENICHEIMYQLCHAGSYMHAIGITHRDLKPENILLRDVSGVPIIKVADFGLAKIQRDLDAHVLMMSVCGSTIYVAPEVVDPRKPGYDHCADSFSAGIIMFTMLLLSSPWCEDRTPPGCVPLPEMRWKCLSRELLSPEGHDLLDHLVQPDPKKRVSLAGALTHRWMTSRTPTHPVA
ncbi:kinase-like domain-containing protein [Mycena epipterygia]|nr:kinase-like domain-containing protein [Mycena epipterygia]